MMHGQKNIMFYNRFFIDTRMLLIYCYFLV